MKGEYVDACFLDISKCFDTVDHDLLLFKLEHHSLIHNELSWFKNTLIGRKQVVCYNGVLHPHRM